METMFLLITVFQKRGEAIVQEHYKYRIEVNDLFAVGIKNALRRIICKQYD